MADDQNAPLLRRSFLARVSAAAAIFGFGGGSSALAQAPSGTGGRFQPALHTHDDWLETVPGKHRLFLDSVNGSGAGDALLFANNFLNTNKSGYALADNDLAIVICLRHFATPYAFTDSVWSKYGAAFTELTKLNDPKTGKAPVINLYRRADYGMTLNNLGTTIDDLIKRGVHFAVCDAATHFISTMIAEATKGNAEAIYKELTSNMTGNSHLVASGIVAVNRAQERGYSVAHCG